ncbi:predicted protein [Aspergillus terreus NIH2624]|uniref:Sodium/calcium exchanger membrane region domain-containing protein n=1 Tax=Aspergillus terreus (strain NIH 2624 / FGSC A1156) TaxID=341663 RepID=Q0C972_ASPTN|nr:uncharacterized protein ATEG_09762 [Aspergillus terreus NIH2624]EAU29953.1 predicted protein [Aspergillus terreus NIH2624]
MPSINWNTLCYNSACLIAGVFVLDYGADKFIDHTALLARRLGISQTLIALLTAGAEYEELAVVIAAVLQKRGSLALGNVMGSTISNILGAFSLGLLVHPGRMQFDRSARSYTAILLGLTTMSAGLTWGGKLNRVTGGILVATFAIYLFSIGFAIYRGVVDAPELSDSDNDSDSDSDSDDVESRIHPSETSRLLGDQLPSPVEGRHAPSLAYHLVHLVIGLVALSLSGYILAQSASAIADSLHLSGTVVGFTILSIATTIPEKLIAIMSGVRGHSGIVVANTAGSNIFLLTLCVGVVALSGEVSGNMSDYMTLFELISVWVSAALLAAVVFLDLGRWMGAVLLIAYAAFLVCEFTVYRR